jgi:BlaI family penicillinase repressor
MEEKGFIGSALENGVKTYFPLLHREEAALKETESFLDRVYDGSISLLVSAMTHKRALPQEEIDQLYALLDELEGKKS